MSKTNTVNRPKSAFFKTFSTTALPLAIISLAISGCDGDEIRVYRAPKSPVIAAADTPTQAPTPTDSVIWSLPSDWSQAPNEQAMRLATFRAGPENVEVSLSAFPGDAGGLLPNINRWRGQLGLDPTDEASLLEEMVSTTANGATTAIVDLQNPDGQRMLASIVNPGDGQTWFVKAIGESAPLETITESFGAFSRSIHMETTVVDEHAGHNHPVDNASSGAASGSLEQRLASFHPPSHWSPEENASPILAASFLATNDSEGARITVTSLVGEGGGALLNINRWRGQLGLAPVDHLDEHAGIVRESPLVVDLATEDQSLRMLAAIIPSGGSSYFVKMTGTVDGAGAELDGFYQLVTLVSGEGAGQ